MFTNYIKNNIGNMVKHTIRIKGKTKKKIKKYS